MSVIKEIVEIGFYNIISKKYGIDGIAYMWGLLISVLICAAAGYFIGSINSALLVSKHKYGVDVRTLGSGNAGMTNMFRNFGKTGGLLTFVGDVAKSVLGVVIGYLVLGYTGSYIAGLFCVVGHVFPVFYKFQGGKGVLVASVMLLLCDWPVFLICLFIFAVILIGTRMVSMASVMSAMLLPLVVYGCYSVFYGNGGVAGIRSTIVMLITVLVVFKHIPNLKRIYAGEESKIRLPWDKKKTETDDERDNRDNNRNSSGEQMKKRSAIPDKNTSKKKKKRK